MRETIEQKRRNNRTKSYCRADGGTHIGVPRNWPCCIGVPGWVQRLRCWDTYGAGSGGSASSAGSRRRLPGPRRAWRSEEPELLKILRRIHESAHAVIGDIFGLEKKLVNSRRGSARVEWHIPAGRQYLIGFLIALAASKRAQERFGAKNDYYRDHSWDDQRKIEETARRITASEADAQELIAAVHRAAERLVNERWDDIEFIVRALEKLDDEIDQEGLQLLLRHVGQPRRPIEKTTEKPAPGEADVSMALLIVTQCI